MYYTTTAISFSFLDFLLYANMDFATEDNQHVSE